MGHQGPGGVLGVWNQQQLTASMEMKKVKIFNTLMIVKQDLENKIEDNNSDHTCIFWLVLNLVTWDLS